LSSKNDFWVCYLQSLPELFAITIDSNSKLTTLYNAFKACPQSFTQLFADFGITDTVW